jgi:hypothetical protein
MNHGGTSLNIKNLICPTNVDGSISGIKKPAARKKILESRRAK